jgi:hypothetical protein
MAKRIVRLTESDMNRLVKKINEGMSQNAKHYEQLIYNTTIEFMEFLKETHREMEHDKTISQKEKNDIEFLIDSIYSGLMDSTGGGFEDED